MVTARTDGADIVEAFRLGANDYVTKPIDFPVAVARIATHLSHKRAVADLRESEERYALSVQGANDGVWDWNLITNEVYWSPRWKAMLGYGESDIGASPDEWLTRVHHDDAVRVKETLQAHLAGGSGHYESEHRMLHRNGTFRWVLCRGAAVRNAEGTATRLAGSLTDVTDAKVSDALTGLPNRLMFVDLVERALSRVHRRPGYAFALLVLGLDRFKDVGNSLGPLTADRLLVAVARRLQSGLRVTDAVKHDDTVVHARASLGRRVHGAARRHHRRHRRGAHRGPSAQARWKNRSRSTGIRCSRRPRSASRSARRNTTVRKRSCAMPRPRSTGRRPTGRRGTSCSIRRCAPARSPGCRSRPTCGKAVEDGGFIVQYQPIVALETGRIVAFEALVRWHHPTRGIVAPDHFIGVAEETGMIVPIGHLALAESCRQMARWQQTFGADAPDADLREHVEPAVRRRRSRKPGRSGSARDGARRRRASRSRSPRARSSATSRPRARP